MKPLTIFAALLGLSAAAGLSAQSPASAPVSHTDTIPYDINYKWGFINKTAGHGQVIMKVSGDTIDASLTGHSIPWGGRIYTVNDSLVATITRADGDFVAEETVLSQNGVYTKPRVSVGADGSMTVARDTPSRNIYGQGTLSASPETMEAVTITSDMLGLFRYGSVIDFSKLTVGKPVTINISGKDPGSVQITYLGPSQVTVGGRSVAASEIVFNYEYEGALSGYPVHAWLDAGTQMPLVISADIRIGHVEMVYAPQKE